MDEGQSTHSWGPFCVFCIQVTRILSEAEVNDWSHADLLPTDFVLIAIPAERTTVLLKNTSRLVFLEIRSIVLILREFIVRNPREVCFQYKSSFLFQPYEKCSRIKNYHEGFPGGVVVENLPANAGDAGSSPGLGRSHMPRSNSAREPKLLSLRVWSLCSATRGRDSERPAHRDEEWTPLATTRESPCTETKTQHSHTYIHTYIHKKNVSRQE